MRHLVAVVVLSAGLMAGAIACAGNPPVKVGPPVPVIQTRPYPTPLEVRACWPDNDRCFIWHSPRFNTYVWGSIQYEMAGTVLCEFRPDWGDTYYSETNRQVLTPPKGCPSYP